MSQPPLDMPEYPNTASGSHPPFARPDGPPEYLGSGQPPYPGYPGSGQPPYPGYPQPSAPPPKKRNVGKIATIGLAALGAVLGSTVVNYALKDHTEKTNAVQSGIRTHVVEPATLGGRPKIVDADLRAVSDQVVATAKKAAPGATGTISAFYGDPAKQDMVMILGVSAHVPSPEKAAGQLVSGMGSGGVKVTNVKSVQPGPLGGAANCGDATIENIPTGVCTWADGNTMGMIVIYFKSGDQTGTELVKLRSEIEQRD
ncbi:hypothetical protein [Planotetraspora mira]|uniref:Uncharacterized protein n=1 Tax=Planotetraspora mira TaxID=58121 RepID=A0A8J3TPA9_9ACTN|nr:hypothetical protein [Planotetraspora mira]GII28887.1 hypothetical protein Pmi06nite_23290 [Planotetraspora mira]